MPNSPAADQPHLDAIDQVIYYLDRSLAPTQKSRAFTKGRAILAAIDVNELRSLAQTKSLTTLDGIGKSIASVASAALLGQTNTYVEELDAKTQLTVDGGEVLRSHYLGDCHSHSTWSDGGANILTMARTARSLGHSYLVMTDHSARLTIAHGLSEERLREQLDEIDAVNSLLADESAEASTENDQPFQVLSGMEVDIFEDGSLDLSDEFLAQLDVVVASAHSKLALESDAMTKRLVKAVANPHVDILGHCTNRKIIPDQRSRRGAGGTRKPSTFDADYVFAACAKYNTAVEINCRPERQDPPDELLRLALQWGCDIAIDSDAHAPGQLEWIRYGCEKAERHGVKPERILNMLTAAQLRARGAHQR